MEVEVDPFSILEQFMQVNDSEETVSVDMLDEDMFDLGSEASSSVTDKIIDPINSKEKENHQEKPAVVDVSPNPLSTPTFCLDSLTQNHGQQNNQSAPAVVNNGSSMHFLLNPVVIKVGPQANDKPSAHPPVKRRLVSSYKNNKNVFNFKKNQKLSMSDQYLANAQKLAAATQEELKYRSRVFPRCNMVVNKKLDCTACGHHIGCRANLRLGLFGHPLLKVLVCSGCRKNYTSRAWSTVLNKSDICCRWCGNPSSPDNNLCTCSFCPFAFCEACITRNYSKQELEGIKSSSGWKCFGCTMTPLYYQRALLWALDSFISSLNKRKVKDPSILKDMSTCCPNKGANEVRTIGECSIVRHIVSNLQSKLVARKSTTNRVVGPARQNFQNPVPLSVSWPRARITSFFTNFENTKGKIVLRFKDAPTSKAELKDVIQDTRELIKNFSRQAEECASALDEWLIATLNSQSPVKAPQLQPLQTQPPRIRPLQPDRQRIPSHQINQIPITQIHSLPKPTARQPLLINPSVTLSVKEPQNDYSELLKKYNIKPCKVVLERCKTDPETCGNESLLSSLLEHGHADMEDSDFNLLIPQVELIETKPTSIFNSLIDEDDEDCIIVE